MNDLLIDLLRPLDCIQIIVVSPNVPAELWVGRATVALALAQPIDHLFYSNDHLVLDFSGLRDEQLK